MTTTTTTTATPLLLDYKIGRRAGEEWARDTVWDGEDGTVAVRAARLRYTDDTDVSVERCMGFLAGARAQAQSIAQP